jgi:SAM-dependent methyltransferase
MDDHDWDQQYGQHDQFWSGRPNPALMVEAAELTPGRALDVGCGEGADAIWLSQRGWHVTGLDVSQVALDRASQAADDQHVDVTWIRSSIAGFANREPHDLVCVLYPALPPQTPVDALLRCVAPGGTLLVVGHAHVSRDHGHAHEEFLEVGQIADQLGEDWIIEAYEQRPRIDPPKGAEHVLDVVLRARRAT